MAMSSEDSWGGYFITSTTVQRMYSLHFLTPFVVAGLLAGHLLCLHYMGSGSASTVPGSTADGDAFLEYYYKDARTHAALLLMLYSSTLLLCVLHSATGTTAML